MKPFLTSLVALGTLAIVSAGCSYQTEGDWFYVRREGADMPVWVKGNEASDTFVVFLHGGPGGSATAFALVGWHDLEEKHRVVYWDQRHAGGAIGNPDPEQTSVASFTDDLELVLDALDARYAPKHIVLYGISWGATVGTAYLSLGDEAAVRRGRIDGFIYAFGNHDFPLAYPFARPRIMARLEAGDLAEGAEPAQRDECSKFYTERVDGLHATSDFVTHFGCIRLVNGYGPSADGMDEGPDLGAAIFASPVSGIALGLNEGTTLSSEPFMQEVAFDSTLSTLLDRIDTPTLTIAGRNDLIAPWEVAQFFDDRVGAAKHELMILEETGHQSYGGSDRLQYTNAISSFVDEVTKP